MFGFGHHHNGIMPRNAGEIYPQINPDHTALSLILLPSIVHVKEFARISITYSLPQNLVYIRA